MATVLNQEYSKLLIDNASGMFLLLNTKAEIVKFSQRLLDLRGLAEEDVIGKPIHEITKTDVSKRKFIQQKFKAACESGEVFRFESEMPTPQGAITILLTFSPIQNEIGETIYVVGEAHDISKQKNYEKQLVDEKAFSNAILNNIADGVFVLDTEGKILFSNAVAHKLFYFDVYPEIEAITTNAVFDFYNLEETIRFSNDEMPYALTLKGEEVQNFKLLMKLQDNLPTSLLGLRDIFQSRYLSISSRSIKNNQNEIVNIVLSYSDITEQTKAIQTQAALQERFSHAFENSVIGITIFSSRGIILDSNQSLCTTLGYEKDELLGKALADITHPDDMTLTDILFNEIESGISNSIYYEKKLKHKNGLAIDSIVGISVSRNSQQQINYIIAHILDATENNKISKALALSQKNYQSIFNSQLDAVIVTNLSGKILNINPSAVKLFGYSVEEIDSLMLWELFSTKEDRLSVFNNLYTEDQEEVHTDTIRYVHRNGEAFPAETVGFLIYDGDGQRLGYTWIIQDVSEKKIAEITLARINQRLAVSREEERRRLARELHDGIVQDLMGFSYELASLEGILNSKDDFTVSADDLKDMRGKLTSSIKQLRSFISDLRPVGLEEFGFQKLTLAHTNTRDVILTIKDDGIGFKVPEDINNFSDSQHFGLIGINERVTLIDGHLAINSQKNKGTTLTMTLPYEMEQ